MRAQRRGPAQLLVPILLVLYLALPALAFGASLPTSGAAFTAALAPQATSGKIEIENLDGVPYNNRLVFQRINAGGITHQFAVLRIKNTDTTPLNVSALSVAGGDNLCFIFLNVADAGPFVVAPGAFRDVKMKFVAGTPALGKTKGLRQSTLTIQSSDPTQPSLPVELAGFNMVFKGGANEPSLQEILDTFGYTSLIVNPGEDQRLRPKVIPPLDYNAVGDEVLSPIWTRANPTNAMYVRQIAALSGGGSTTIEISGPGGGKVTHDAKSFQSFLPLSDSTAPPTAPTEMTVKPTKPFEVKISGYSSNRQPTQISAVRFWTVRDRDGNLVPNSYIVAQDYVGNSATNYDYQDNVYLITNIRPVNQASDPSVPAAAPGAPNLVLEFDRDTYPGTLTDKDNQTIGFPETQRNKNDISTPHRPPSSSYDKTRLDLNTADQGTLTITTLPGTNAGADNTLVNGLCLPFDGRGPKFAIGTTLLGPLTNLTAAFQQAGVMFGPSQGNYVKLVAGVQENGAAPVLQLVRELNGVLTPVGGATLLPDPATIATLELQLIGDAATGTVAAAYRVNGGDRTMLPDSVTLTGASLGRFFDPQSAGCLVATHTNATKVDVLFDRFAIFPAPPDVGLPSVNAGPDQEVPTGALVTLAGSASDALGAPLTGTWQQSGGSPLVALSGSGNTVTFTAPGAYTVLAFTFVASDRQNRSATDSATVTVGDAPISGLALSSNSPVSQDKLVLLTATTSAGAAPIAYVWNFGDATPSVTGGPTLSHSYSTPGSYQVTVSATNSVGSASAQTTVLVQAIIPPFALRYDVGAKDNKPVTTPDGLVWQSDAGLFTPANSPAEKRPTPPAIAETTNDVIYQTYRGKNPANNKAPVTFEIPLNSQIGVPAGTQVIADIRLHFAELFWDATASRVFNVFIENTLALDRYDIFLAAGGKNTAVVAPINGVLVADGKVTISLAATVDNASLAAIEILSPPENVPVVDAGPDQNVTAKSSVSLSGSASSSKLPLTYSWTQIGGVPVALNGSGSTRTFVPPTSGDYLFTLTATDPDGLSGSDTVVVTATRRVPGQNGAPQVDAGPDKSVAAGAQVTLSGNASDPDNDPLTFAWTQNSGPAVALSSSGSSASFTPAAPGSYVFTLTASDPGGLSGADTVVVTVGSGGAGGNAPPQVQAGPDQDAAVGAQVTLSGSASDPDNDPLTFAWTQNSGPAVALSSSGSSASFTPIAPGSYVFTLTASDPGGLSGADTVVVTVREATIVANAGPDQRVPVGSTVALNGLGSSDSRGGALTYRWQQTSGPAVALSDATAAQPSFTAPAQPTVLAFSLVVTNSLGQQSAADDVQVTVEAGPTANPPTQLFLPIVVR